MSDSPIGELLEPLSRNRDPNLTQNEHVYAICCRVEVAGDVISCEMITDHNDLLNFEAGILISFRENQNQPFAQRVDYAGPLEPHLRGQGAKMS